MNQSAKLMFVFLLVIGRSVLSADDYTIERLEKNLNDCAYQFVSSDVYWQLFQNAPTRTYDFSEQMDREQQIRKTISRHPIALKEWYKVLEYSFYPPKWAMRLTAPHLQNLRVESPGEFPRYQYAEVVKAPEVDSFNRPIKGTKVVRGVTVLKPDWYQAFPKDKRLILTLAPFLRNPDIDGRPSNLTIDIHQYVQCLEQKLSQ